MKKTQTDPAKNRTKPPLPDPEPYDKELHGPMSPYHPRWDAEEQASFALGSIAVVEELLSLGGPTKGGAMDGATRLLWWSLNFLETLDLERNAEGLVKEAARRREVAAEAARLVTLRQKAQAAKTGKA